MQRFLPFLPDGESAGGEAVAVINEDLEYLLAADAAEMWSLAKADSSLLLLIGSFLQYARRPYDEGFRQQSATELSVWQHMLPLLHRLVCGQEPGAPPKADRAALLSRLLDFPRLLDICSLYGALVGGNASGSSSSSTSSSSTASTASAQLSQVVAAALQLLPRLGSQAAAAGPVIAQNLGQVVEACLAAAGKAGRDAAMAQSLADGILYLRDTCLTLASLVAAHPPAAALLLQQGPELVEALGAVHDQLLPAVHKVARSGTSVSTGGSSAPPLLPLLRQACHVELASERLAQQLLLHTYIQPAAAASGGGGSSSGAGSSSAGGSGGSAVARGEALLHALMLLGHTEEESGHGGGGSSGTGDGSLSLGQAIAQRQGLGGSILAALQSGSLSLDDAQADYVAALLGMSSLEEAPGPPLPTGNAGGGSGSSRLGGAGAGAGGSGSGGAAGSGGVHLSMLRSKIQQVTDLLPDYGEGFVAACLQQLGGSPERVLNALLEGAPPPHCAELDQQMSLDQWQRQYQQYQQQQQGGAGAAGAADKGKRPLSYEEEFPAVWGGLGLEGASPASFSAASAGGAGTAATAAARSAAAEGRTARYLDVREGAYREALVAAATAAQWEYEDEYDDSFDDLVPFGADGVAEVEEAVAADRAGAAAQAGGGGSRLGMGMGGAGGGRGVGGEGGGAADLAAAQRGLQGLSLQQQHHHHQRGGAGAAAAAAGPKQQAQQQQRGGGGRGKGSKLWVLDGRIYNYAKPGAQEVGSREEADAALAAAQQAAQEILGLGPGGNKPWRSQEQQQKQQQQQQGGANQGGPSGSGRGGGGAGRGDHRYKDQHKAGIANHHRKDRAVQKQSKGMW